MAKTERELAFVRDLDINETWTKRFTDLLDKHVGFKKAEKILYINAGTGDHCIAVREKVNEKTEMFATCENDELLKIARDKGAATKSAIEFSEGDFDDDSFDAVIADASFTRPEGISGFITEAVRVAKPGGEVAIVLPSAGSFGEVFSLLWEVFFNEELGDDTNAAETLIARIPSISRIEEIASNAGLTDVKSETTKEVFEYENGAEFVASPLVADFLLPVWFETLDEDQSERATQKLSQLIDDEDGSLTFRFTVKATLVTGKKEHLN
jgi:ubiquinone/menaquinone biosynthesis C-methylase UbiE